MREVETVEPVDSRKEYLAVRRIEAQLSTQIEGFLACSEGDRLELENLNGGEVPGFTVPNGVDTEQKTFDVGAGKRQRNVILFCGTLSYPPNADGLSWFHREIWPKIRLMRPSVRLRVVGHSDEMPEALRVVAADRSVDFIGTVEDVAPHYAAASISAVPLRMGSGTRLKILEAMAFGTPVVSTSKGAEGIAYENGKDVRIADEPQAFAEAIRQLLQDEERFEMQRRAARSHVEQHYDWCVVGKLLIDALKTVKRRRWDYHAEF